MLAHKRHVTAVRNMGIRPTPTKKLMDLLPVTSRIVLGWDRAVGGGGGGGATYKMA